jgi:RHS repeat-associated protein
MSSIGKNSSLKSPVNMEFSVCIDYTRVYRFAFNGKENDNEVEGLGNWQDYGERMFSIRLGRFPNPDPLTKEYPFYSPFQFSGNSPIDNVDLDGLEPLKSGYVTKDMREGKTKLNLPNPQKWSNTTKKPQTPATNPTEIPKLAPKAEPAFVTRLYGSTYGEHSGNDNPGNDRVYDPDGLQGSIGGNVLNYSGSFNVTYLKNFGVGINLTGTSEYTGTSLVSFGPTFTEITFASRVPIKDRTFKALEGEGFNTSGTLGPLTVGIGGANDPSGKPTYSTFSFGTGMPGKLGKLNINASGELGVSKETNTTTPTFRFINLEK